MNQPKGLHEFLDQSFARFHELPSDRVDSACDRVLDRLRVETERAPAPAVVRTRPPRRYGRLLVVVAVALATVVFAERLVTKRSAEPLPVTEIVSPAVQPTPVTLPKEPPQTPPPPLAFAVASLKPVAPGTVMPAVGLECHGIDGVQSALIRFSIGGHEVTAGQGRCVGAGIFLPDLIELAYGVSLRHLSGGPDWSRVTLTTPSPDPNESPFHADKNGLAWTSWGSFQIDAIADDPSTATLDQLRQMLQHLLVDRFKLKFHREEKGFSGYLLVVAESGHKMKPIVGSYEESLELSNGKSTMGRLARALRNIYPASPPIANRTGLTGAYEYELRLVRRRPVVGGDGARGGPPSLSDRIGDLSSALEQQLGLRLQSDKSVPDDVFIIDHVEPPSPN